MRALSPEPEPATFVLDCSPEACGAVFPVEGNDDDEESEESEPE